MKKPLMRFALCLSMAVPAIIGLTHPQAASAATAGPGGLAFYTVPSSLPSGPHGTLVQYAGETVNLGSKAPSVNAWKIMYLSTDSVGAQDVVTGTLLVPTKSWPNLLGLTPRPLVAYAPGTQGLAQKCAPSLQMAAGTEYENANIAAALNKNWAVVVTDYEGYTTGSIPTYLAGRAEGNAVLDSATAAFQVPGSTLSSTAQTAIWGYSQGGQAAAWAGQLAPGYASTLHIAGVAAGGVPANFDESANNLDGNVGAAFLLGGVIGLSAQYPNQIPLSSLANAAGQQAIAEGESICVFQALSAFHDDKLSQFTNNGETLAQFESDPNIGPVLSAQNLATMKIQAPLFLYQGQADEFIPLDQAIAAKQAWCNLGTSVQFDYYPGEHIMTQFQAAPDVISWISSRFSGIPQIGNCFELAQPPSSTANPGGGDFVVSLNQWNLTGSINVKALGQSLALPGGSSFSAQTDLTSDSLTGNLSVPQFTDTITLLGIPVQITITLTPIGSTTASVSLDNNGDLHLSGMTQAIVNIKSVGDLGISIPVGCQTVTPVQFPLSFNGPVSSLGDGSLTFSGTTTFPNLTGCGLEGPALQLLFSGPGNTFTFTVAPTAATPY